MSEEEWYRLVTTVALAVIAVSPAELALHLFGTTFVVIGRKTPPRLLREHDLILRAVIVVLFLQLLRNLLSRLDYIQVGL